MCKVLFLCHFLFVYGKMYSKEKGDGQMYTYEVYNKTRGTYCTITSNNYLEVGQRVLIEFNNEEIDGLHECEVIERINGAEC